MKVYRLQLGNNHLIKNTTKHLLTITYNNNNNNSYINSNQKINHYSSLPALNLSKNIKFSYSLNLSSGHNNSSSSTNNKYQILDHNNYNNIISLKNYNFSRSIFGFNGKINEERGDELIEEKNDENIEKILSLYNQSLEHYKKQNDIKSIVRISVKIGTTESKLKQSLSKKIKQEISDKEVLLPIINICKNTLSYLQEQNVSKDEYYQEYKHLYETLGNNYFISDLQKSKIYFKKLVDLINSTDNDETWEKKFEILNQIALILNFSTKSREEIQETISILEQMLELIIDGSDEMKEKHLENVLYSLLSVYSSLQERENLDRITNLLIDLNKDKSIEEKMYSYLKIGSSKHSSVVDENSHTVLDEIDGDDVDNIDFGDKEIQKALSIATSKVDTLSMSHCLYLLSEIESARSNYELSLKYINDCIDLLKINDSYSGAQKGVLLYSKGMAYKNMDDINNAIETLEEAFGVMDKVEKEAIEEIKSKKEKTEIDSSIHRGREKIAIALSEIYNEKDDEETFVFYFNFVGNIALKSKTKPDRHWKVPLFLANYFLQNENYEKSLQTYAFVLSKIDDSITNHRSLMTELFSTDSKYYPSKENNNNISSDQFDDIILGPYPEIMKNILVCCLKLGYSPENQKIFANRILSQIQKFNSFFPGAYNHCNSIIKQHFSLIGYEQ